MKLSWEHKAQAHNLAGNEGHLIYHNKNLVGFVTCLKSS